MLVGLLPVPANNFQKRRSDPLDFFVKLFRKGRRITDIAAMMLRLYYFGLLGVSAASCNRK